MGLRFPSQIFEKCFFVTTTYADFKRLGDIPGFLDQVSLSIVHCLEKYNALLIAYTLMPDHIHLLLIIDGKQLSGFMRDFKKYISQKVAKDFNLEQPIWKPRYDRMAIRDEKVLLSRIRYIHNNPVRAELSESSEDWKYSSAGAYESDKIGPIPIFKEWI